MNKHLMTGLCLLLSACVTTPDSRPEPFLKSEELLREGLNAYKNDNFTEAQQKFSRALELYQSFDNQRGIILSQSNLVETALATSDFAKAELYLAPLKQQADSDDLDSELKRKITLLDVKLQFEQQHYQAALANLKPLMAEPQKPDVQLSLLAMQARLEVLISPLDPSEALAKFESVVAQTSPPALDYQALLKRLRAFVAFKRGDYQTATALFTGALAYYKEQANRRSIASCLEELAEVEIAQQHSHTAQDYLNKALVIRQWLKNEYKSNKIRQQLVLIKSSAAQKLKK